MPYAITPTSLPDVLILEPQVFRDDRGFFFESFNAQEFARITGVACTFVQDNHSRSTRGVLRGLHYQIQHPQGKLVRVIQGEVFDVVVDMRRNSRSFSKWVGVKLSAENKHQLWVPKGFAHGFLVMSEYAEFLYKTTDYWHAKHERSLLWSDPQIGIQWPLEGLPQLAKKDETAKLLCDAETFE